MCKCPSGIEAIGDTRWGTHFCQFYRTKQDLLDILVPFMAAGLRNGEYCTWVTSPSLSREEAIDAMRRRVPEFNCYLDRGQIELWEWSQWYQGRTNDQVLAQWMEKYEGALKRGFNGMRLSGDTIWLHRQDWEDFMAYERRVNDSFGQFQIIGLCTYSLETCTGEDVLDVVGSHQFALARRQGKWEVIEGTALREARRDLERVENSVHERVAQKTQNLQSQIDERDRFIAMLGHELRNPLAAIRNGAHLLRSPRLGATDMVKVHDMIERQANHLGGMVEELLDIARITSGRINLTREPVDLASLCAAAVEDYRAAAERAQVSLICNCSGAATQKLMVHGNATRLSQVLGNLIDNAIKFSHRGGTVRVTCETAPEGAEVVVRIADEGMGIEPEFLQRIFEPFAQADDSLDRSAGGLGLGLAVVKGLVEMHDGSVSAFSRGRGQGTTIIVRLPIARAASAVNADASESSRIGGAPALSILIIEDNEDAAESMRMMLDLEGHETRVAHTGNEGVAEALRCPPDVVLCDIGLRGGTDGYAVARLLRNHSAMRNARLIAITGYGQPGDVERARQAGFHLHLTKPVSPADLLNAVQVGDELAA